jgi:hypothetical protein
MSVMSNDSMAHNESYLEVDIRLDAESPMYMCQHMHSYIVEISKYIGFDHGFKSIEWNITVLNGMAVDPHIAGNSSGLMHLDLNPLVNSSRHLLIDVIAHNHHNDSVHKRMHV